jgi:uncharacterized protein
MGVVASLIAGLVFGIGLVISGMADPAKVKNFLDLAGTWDPSLAFVMAGAILVTFAGYRWLQPRARPFAEPQFYWPTARDIDTPLVAGAALFGVGWGLGGFCPGPSLAALPLLAQGTLVFVPAMLIGMWGARTLSARRQAMMVQK